MSSKMLKALCRTTHISKNLQQTILNLSYKLLKKNLARNFKNLYTKRTQKKLMKS
jgi:hypothetical protein